MLNTSSSEDDYDEEISKNPQKCPWSSGDMISMKSNETRDNELIYENDCSNNQASRSGVYEHYIDRNSLAKSDKTINFRHATSKMQRNDRNLIENVSLSSHISSQVYRVEGENMFLERTSPFDSCWSSDQQNSCELESLRSESTTSVKHPLNETHAKPSKFSKAFIPNQISGTSQQIFYSTSSGLGSGSNVPTPKLKPSQTPCKEEGDVEDKIYRFHLQIYIFVIRCIAYPFSVRPSEEPIRRYLKITKEHLNIIIERFQNFLQGKLSIVCDEEFFQAIESYYSTFLKSDRVSNMVKSGGCSLHDFREVFIISVKVKYEQNSENQLQKTILPAWKVKFDQICRGGEGPSPEITKLTVPQAELINPSTDQLYEMFMKILCVKKYEYQILFNACQLDNIDEQATQVRRELSHSIEILKTKARTKDFPKLAHKEMETDYFEEEMARKNELLFRLDSLPVSSGNRILSHSIQMAGNMSLISTNASPNNVLQHIQRKWINRHHASTTSKSNSTHNINNLFSSPKKRSSMHNYAAFPNRSAVPSPKLMGSRFNKERLSIISLSEDANVDPIVLAGLASNISHSTSTPYNIRANNKLSIEVPIVLEVFVNRLKTVSFNSAKSLFIQIENEGSGEKLRTESIKSPDATWDTVAEFRTKVPLVELKVKLCQETSGPSLIDDRELGKVHIYPTRQFITRPIQTYFQLTNNKCCQEKLELQLTISVKWPSNIKYCGFCWVKGKTFYKKWKLRFLCLVQVSQYKFVLAHFKEKKSISSTFMPLDGFTIDFCPAQEELIQLTNQMIKNDKKNHIISSIGSMKFRDIFPTIKQNSTLHFCNLVREGETAHLATYEQSELNSWVQSIYRATGQSHKPSFLVESGSIRTKRNKKNVGCEKSIFLESMTQIQPETVDQNEYFCELQRATLEYRLKDPFVSLGWFSPSQCLVLDEYCARYGIREFQRHLYLLEELLDKAEHGIAIDPDLMHYSYSLCANYAMGKSHQKVHAILASEKNQYKTIKNRLLSLLERQITEFRYCFPFGRPEGALEKMLSLLERVLTKDNGEPASADVVRSKIQNCLRNAAVLNYERISEYALIEVSNDIGTRSMLCDNVFRRLEENIHLGELCIEVLQQNQLHYSDAFSWFNDLFVEHAENFLALYQLEIEQTLSMLPKDTWEVFHLFQILNNFLNRKEQFTKGNFHSYLIEKFQPMIDRYLTVMERSINEALIKGIESETWEPGGNIDPEIGEIENVTETINSQLTTQQHTSHRMEQLQYESRQQNNPKGINKVDPALVFAETAHAAVNVMNVLTGSSASFCCITILDLINKLKQLKSFVNDLNWPVEQTAQAFEERVSIMCARLLKEAAKLTLIYFEISIRQCVKTTNLVITKQSCTMINTLIEIRTKLYSLCEPELGLTTDLANKNEMNNNNNNGNERGSRRNAINSTSSDQRDTGETGNETTSNTMVASSNTPKQMHKETEDFIDIIQRKFIVIIAEHLVLVLQNVLGRLTRYDEDKLMSSIMVLAKPKDEDGKMYVNFLHANLQRMSKYICDEVYTIALFEKWYTLQMRMIYEWIVYRKHILLHPYQIKCLETIVKKIYSDFELQGLPVQTLDTITYQTICSRLQVEETTISVKQNSGSMSMFSPKFTKSIFSNPFNR